MDELLQGPFLLIYSKQVHNTDLGDDCEGNVHDEIEVFIA